MGTKPGYGVGLIDSGFKPGKKANADIAEYMEYEGDFCDSEDTVTEVLETMQIFDALFQLQDENGDYFCVFEHYGELLTTRPYKKSVHALAAVAHYLVMR